MAYNKSTVQTFRTSNLLINFLMKFKGNFHIEWPINQPVTSTGKVPHRAQRGQEDSFQLRIVSDTGQYSHKAHIVLRSLQALPGRLGCLTVEGSHPVESL